MTKKIEYWQDIENKTLDPEVLKSEFADGELSFDIGSVKKSRRSFLKTMGFSFSAMPLLSSCLRIPVKKAMPYIFKSEQVVPGVANWYATSIDPSFGASLLVKTREGRPIKIEGNPLSLVTRGGTMASDQASVLSLYDSHRYKGPKIKGVNTQWLQIDEEVKEKLKLLIDEGKEIHLITGPISSPSTIRVIKKLKKKYPTLKHLVYEPAGAESILQANRDCFGISSYPQFLIENTKLIVSFSADFLGTWISPVEFTKQYSASRDLLKNKTMSRHIHFESMMTLTGSNADERYTVSPYEEHAFIINLLAYLQKKGGDQYLPQGEKLPPTNRLAVAKIGDELWNNKGQSLVLAGSSNKNCQIMVNAINEILENYGKTLILKERPHFLGPDLNEIEKYFSSNISNHGVIFWDVNPVYDYQNADLVANYIKRSSVSVSLSTKPDETSEVCSYVMPANHYLEAWNDYINSNDQLLIAQPVIQPLFSTRTAQETLLVLADEKADYYDFIKNTAKSEFKNKQSKYLTFTDFWNHTVHDGVAKLGLKNIRAGKLDKKAVIMAFAKSKSEKDSNKTLLITYKSIPMGTGRQANNPWLHELPDPVTKATWGNYFLISKKKADSLNLKTGSVIRVSSKKHALELPVVVQPGMSENTLSLALGYGRKISGKVGKNLGGNAFPFGVMSEVKIAPTGKFKMLPLTQTHHSMEGRDIVRETTLSEWKLNPKSGNKESIKLISMWSKHDKTGEQWAMAIDLNKCTGCSGCVISCNAENNVPVVGPEEVKNRREMHWLRIDRYYKGSDENPEVVHQPVMCQHCDNAPCETVCPVLATVQSSDGLNQQVYNRCVGTRYCANNCPYKVRRFNWFDYPHNDQYENMVLNPDVTVRSRGVMEKCSMCIQRIQEGRLEAKKRGQKLEDGAIKLACQQSCPGDAIVFGNLNDPNSDISKLLKNARNYKILEELNVQPRVSYLTKVRNKG